MDSGGQVGKTGVNYKIDESPTEEVENGDLVSESQEASDTL